MMPDASPHAAPAALEPAASLTSVRVKRRKLPVAPTGKRGDLTLGGAAAPERTAEPVIALPPPVEHGVAKEIQDVLPFDEAQWLPVERAVVEEVQDVLPSDEALPSPIDTPPEADAPLAIEEPEPFELLLSDEVELPAETAHEAADAEEPRPALRLVETPPLTAGPEDAALPEREAEPEPEAPSEPDLLDYWDSLRGGRDVPALDELDRAHVGATWPNTLLLAVEASDLPRITRLGEGDGEIDYTATVIDWIMSRARSSAKRGEPMEEERRFAVSEGSARYRLLLLPMSSYGLSCDHVLCQLARVAEEERGTVASIKRWLAW